MTAFDPSQNYFQLFQLPESYQVDQSALSARYRDLQREVHPDRYAGGTEKDRLLAVQYSAWVNQAYQGLKSPVARAHYLLSLSGIDVDGQKTTTSDPAFLMHQMSMREQLMEVKGHENPEQAFDSLTAELDELIEHQCAAFERSFTEKDYAAATEEVAKMQFLFKLEKDVEQLEAEILDY